MKYQFLFAVFNTIAAITTFLLVFFIIYEINNIVFRTEDPEDRILKVNGGNANQVINDRKAEKNVERDSAVIGKAPDNIPPKPFEWGKDEELILEAMHLFSQKNKWEACLYLASIQNRKKLDMQEVEQFTEKYYQEVIIRGLMKEFDRSGCDWKQEYRNFDDLFNDLGLTYSLTMINNLRAYMEKENAIPKDIADLMIRVFLNSVNNPFLKIVSFDMLNQEEINTVNYVNAKEFADRCLAHQNKRYLEMYMQQCLGELWRHWFQADKSLRKWILDSPSNRDEYRNLVKAAEDKDEYLTEKEFSSLSSLHRQIIANYAVRKIKDRSQSTFFENFSYWNEEVKREAKKLDTARTNILFLRKNYRWIVLLNSQEYKKAFNMIKVCYKALTAFEMPKELEQRFWKMVEAEKDQWDDIVSKTAWKLLVANATHGKKKLTRKGFWKCLYELFPSESRTEGQKILIATCMINRGFNPQVFVNLKINYNLLKKYVPEDELNGQ